MNTLEKNPAGFPDGLPYLNAPAGKCWEFMGAGYRGKEGEEIAMLFVDRSWNDTWSFTTKAGGAKNIYYARLVPEKPAVRRFKLPKKGYTYDFAEFRGSQVFWVRENGNELRSNLKAEEVPSMIGFDKWIELPAETEPDCFSEEAQLAVRKAWAENPSVLRDMWDGFSKCWVPVVSKSWTEGIKYRLRPSPPKPPEPKRVQIREGLWAEFLEPSGVAFQTTSGANSVVSYLSGEELSKLVAESKGGKA